MADSSIIDEIASKLREVGPIVVESDGEFRHVAMINGSCRAVKSALSALIRMGHVIRHRPEPQGCADQGRPITFKLTHRSNCQT